MRLLRSISSVGFSCVLGTLAACAAGSAPMDASGDWSTHDPDPPSEYPAPSDGFTPPSPPSATTPTPETRSGETRSGESALPGGSFDDLFKPADELVASAPQEYQQQYRDLTATAVGDHDDFASYLGFQARQDFEHYQLGLDLSRRVRFVVVDGDGVPINNAELALLEPGISGRTHADGIWDYYPSFFSFQVPRQLEIQVSSGQSEAQFQVQLDGYADDQTIRLQLDDAEASSPRALELCFLIDATGSMEDELRYVNREVAELVRAVESEMPQVDVRVGATFYRDRDDSPPIEQIAFTDDVDGFSRAMQAVYAHGGGDYPEDLDQGLREALEGMSWSSSDQAVRLLVVIADAPPKSYQTNFSYRDAMWRAGEYGVRLLPVAASGADREVETLFRAMGAYTSTPYITLTDDSGIGGGHLSPDAAPTSVEYFSDLLERLIVSDLRGLGMHAYSGQSQAVSQLY